jgi:hypothetical protein
MVSVDFFTKDRSLIMLDLVIPEEKRSVLGLGFITGSFKLGYKL